MGLDALVAGLMLGPSASEDVSLFDVVRSGEENTRRSYAGIKESIKTVRIDLKRGRYRGRAHEAVERIAEELEELRPFCEAESLGCIHAFKDHAEANLAAGLEAYARDDTRSARTYFNDARDAALDALSGYDDALRYNLWERDHAERAYAVQAFVYASILHKSIVDERYAPTEVDPTDALQNAVLYVRENGLNREMRTWIGRGLGLARASRFGELLGAYQNLRTLERASSASP